MRQLLIVGLIVSMTGVAGITGSDQASRGFQGAWQVTEFVIPGPQPRTIPRPEPRTNLIVFTGKYYSRVEDQSQAARPVLADVATASADQLRAAWGPFVGEAGTYEVAGNVITMHPIASKNPAVMGPDVFIAYTFTIGGDRLTLTQSRNQDGPFATPFTLRAVRVE